MLNRQKYLLSCAVTALLIGGITPAEAKISPLVLKNSTQYFQKGKEYNSPVLGEAALESGFIFDQRFYGYVERAYKEDQSPDYINDKGLDPIVNLIKQFFPSPAGHLAVETIAQNNFAKYVRNPETIAHLLNFANDTRAYLEREQSLLQEKKAENERKKTTSQKLKDLASEITNKKQDIQNTNKAKKASKKNVSLSKAAKEDQFNNQQAHNELLTKV